MSSEGKVIKPARPPRHEAGKAQRRRRIVEAAAALIRECGADDVSMVRIAQLAEVSPTTLYNLFDTKRSLFEAVFQQERRDFVDRILSIPTDTALDRIFLAVDLSTRRYENDRNFHRAAMQHVNSESMAARMSRLYFWKRLLNEAVGAGELDRSLDPELLAALIVQLANGINTDSLHETGAIDRLELLTLAGIALLLDNYATAKSKSAIAARINAGRSALLVS